MARRLLASYLALILLIVALLAFSVRGTTARTFSDYLRHQAHAHSQMLPVMLAGYYTGAESWNGVQPAVESASVLIGAQVTLVDTRGVVVASSQPALIGVPGGELPAQALSMPVLGMEGTGLGVVSVGENLHQQRADEMFLADVTRALVTSGLTIALLAAMVGTLLARSMSAPLAAMARAAQQIARGDYTVGVTARGRDEIAALAGAFNHMAEGIRQTERLRRELVANVSHDLRTPLTVIRGYLEGLRSGTIADRRSAERAFEAMEAEVQRLLRLVHDLRQVAALDAGASALTLGPVAPAELVQEALRRLGPLAEARGVALRAELAPDLRPVAIDQERIGQALFNLVENALQHTPPAGEVVLAAALADHDLVFTVTDSGTGIPPEHLPYIFERFYRVDRARTGADQGSGIGLAIVRAIVEAHGGQVSAASAGAGQGSRFTLRLPRLNPAEDAPRPPTPC